MQAQVILAAGVDAEHELIILQRPGVELGRTVDAVGRVHGVLGAELDLVRAVAEIDVDAPFAQGTTYAPCGGPVSRIGQDFGQVAVRILAARAVVGVLGRVGRGAVEGGGRGVALLIAGPAIGFPAGRQRGAGVQIDRQVFSLGVALTAGDAAQGRVDVRAVGAVAIPVLDRGGQEAFIAQSKALPSGYRQGVAVPDAVLATVEAGVVGDILAIGDGRPAAVARLAQTQVQHPGDGV